jgi:dienelactone hydrolase
MGSSTSHYSDSVARQVTIPAGGALLHGGLNVPAGAFGIVLFVHGSGSSRHSPRNRFVAERIQARGLGTLLFDLLTADEEQIDTRTRHLRFDVGLLAARLEIATRSVEEWPETAGLRVGYFGASTGAAAALVAAAALGDRIGAVVSRGGRPDLAGDALPFVTAPTLLVVGGWDDAVMRLNSIAYDQLRCVRDLAVVENATHLFEEPGKLDEVAGLAADWFAEYLRPRPGQAT